ncbi:unnamed protein product [Pleuronectes platessa]|uniref:Uncharacterized protein n=1 Tax=Pleuronectes platessa TaxID=8262 RepID=A0A9N7TFZ2_PLEPL|nr:unnamed protein product [Pleuronectes platessa]
MRREQWPDKYEKRRKKERVEKRDLGVDGTSEKLSWKKGDVILPDEGAVLSEEKDTVNSSLSWRNFLEIC